MAAGKAGGIPKMGFSANAKNRAPLSEQEEEEKEEGR
jgi:hypothetical protein